MKLFLISPMILLGSQELEEGNSAGTEKSSGKIKRNIFLRNKYRILISHLQYNFLIDWWNNIINDDLPFQVK